MTMAPRRLAALGLAAVLTASLLAAVQAHQASAAAISCYTASDNAKTWYDGPSASYRYDARFSLGPYVGASMLDTRVPQGMTAWNNWNGGSADLLLVTAYRDGSDSWIQGINPKTGNKSKIIRIKSGHVGGIAISGKWAFVSEGSRIRTYRLRDFRRVLNGKANGNYVTYDSVSSVYASSFIATRGGQVYAGKFNKGDRDFMYRYKVSDSGRLTRVGKRIQVPRKTQGLAITKHQFLYSTSHDRDNRSNIYVVERGKRFLDNARLTCFRAPSMSEGIALYGGKAYVVYESGSYKYRGSARNAIRRLHKVPVSQLLSIPRHVP